jgi:hypothetical protein
MPRFITITLEQRGVACLARLLDEDAPRTCSAVWDALPQAGDAQHAKYARNEVYTIVPQFAPVEPGYENPTVTPIPGDVMYFSFSEGMLDRGFRQDQGLEGRPGVVDLAIFYGRNNLLINGDIGWVVGNVFATIVEGLDEMALACHDVWRSGSVGERLVYARSEARSGS